MGTMWKLASAFGFIMNKFSTLWSDTLLNIRIEFVSNAWQKEHLDELVSR
jgi:hypothetical protein